MEAPNPSKLTLLKEYLGDDPVQILEMVQLFLVTYPSDIEEMEQSCLEQDYSRLQKTAHRLKSSVQLFNLEGAREIVVTIETHAKNHTPFSDISPLIQAFKARMESEAKMIQNEIQQL